MPANKILVALDDSEASRELVPAVAARAQAMPDVRLVLCHVLPALPPDLLESPGAENPKEEQKVEGDLASAQARWTKAQTAQAAQLVEACARRLEQHGIARERVEVSVTEPVHSHASLPDVLLDVARTRGCGTIAVGRKAFPALVSLFHAHVGEELRRRADDLDVWIVDEG